MDPLTSLLGNLHAYFLSETPVNHPTQHGEHTGRIRELGVVRGLLWHWDLRDILGQLRRLECCHGWLIYLLGRTGQQGEVMQLLSM